MKLSTKLSKLSINLSKEGVTCHAHWLIILHANDLLSDYKVATASYLARESGISPSGLTEHLDRLEKNGILTRQHSKLDRRKVNVLLTEKGITIAKILEKFLG